MINLERSSLYRDSLDYLGQQMNFPEKMTFHPKISEETISKSRPDYEDSLAYREVMMSHTLSEVKATYTDTFDFSKKHPFYMTFDKFDTQKERGQILAKLKALYEIFRLKMVDSELSDFLPLMLQFLQVTGFKNNSRTRENLQLTVMIIGDSMYKMANTLVGNNNPYAYVVSALRRALKACIVPLEEMEDHA